ncbi:MAG: flagellar type III secretion system pore protein FliP [Deltaproteobacteria bacterium]|nr:flagellar type III secretion system pore protein FliP [Deltaproteobacteria bacterium]
MKRRLAIIILAAFALLASGAAAQAASASGDLNLSVTLGTGTRHGEAALVEIILLVTLLSVTPGLVLLMTSFTRVAVVFAILRQAIGIPNAPANQIITGFSLFLTLFIMSPVISKVNEDALGPYMRGRIDAGTALTKGMAPLRAFMLRNTRAKELEMFQRLAKAPDNARPEDAGTLALIPAFVTSELRAAFQIGFLIYIPFLVIDMVAASVLMSLGMMMMPPAVVSLPFKLLLFVLVDGWYLIVGSLVRSFNG